LYCDRLLVAGVQAIQIFIWSRFFSFRRDFDPGNIRLTGLFDQSRKRTPDDKGANRQKS